MMENIRGLTSDEVIKRRLQYGINMIPESRYGFLKLVLRQLKGIFNLLLMVAAIIAFILGEPVDGFFILFFVLLGTSLNIYQEFKANAAVKNLKSYLRRTITVFRDGQGQEISTEDIVPGDMLQLESGDIVPADANVYYTRDLLVDETTFTGESIPVSKQASATEGQIGDENRLLQGTVVVRGNAIAEVTNTGTRTRLATIAANASVVKEDSGLVKGIDRISGFILRSTLITLLFVVLANILIDGRDSDIPHLIIFSIALAVSVIPEALPMVLTFSLSRGAIKFARKGVIVKRLSSVLDLGSVNLLCTDKTGTLTENRLVFANEFRISNDGYYPLILARLASHDLNKRNPEPFDRAADEALSESQREQVNSFELVEEEAFDPDLRSNGAIVMHRDGTRIHIRRGSPEYFFGLGLVDRQHVDDWLHEEEKQGHRVLGVSYDDGSGARFAGFVSFVDKLKQTTVETISAAKSLNIDITIITGDARVVAVAVGRQAGLVSADSEVMEAGSFLSLPVQQQKSLAGKIRVFARTTPEQKLELIELLKQMYYVGYLGEGINDAPALRCANVSMVVQSAADVARETADIVLLENDLRVIIDGIRTGRETHANTLKYIRATLVSNFGNFYAVSIGSLFIDFLPMLPKQLLLLNLLSDFPMMAIVFDRVSDREVSNPQQFNFTSLYIIFLTLGLISTVFDFIFFGLFYRISPEVLQTNWYIGSVLTELLLILSVRSMLPAGKAGWPAPPIIILTLIAFVIAIVLPMIPATATFFEFVQPTPFHLGLIVSLAVAYLIITELVKRPLARYLHNQG